MVWQVELQKKIPGQKIMSLDLEPFNRSEQGGEASMLRLYSWSPACVSLGYSQKIDEEIDVQAAHALGWDVVKRPTGGGIVFHNEAEVTYSLITSLESLPKGLVPSYIKISEAIVLALKKIGITAQIRNPKSDPSTPLGTRIRGKSEIRNPNLCFSYPAEYEIVWQGRKLVGSAQKRGKRTLLQQGSIFVKDTSDDILSVLKKPQNNDHRKSAISLEEILGRRVGFDELSRALIGGFEEGMGIQFKT